MSEITDEFREKMSEWVDLKKQLVTIKADVKVLTDKEKNLKTFITEYMKDKNIDNVNLRKGKVTYKKTSRKGSLTPKIIETGLMIYFNQDEAKVESVLTCILDQLETKQSECVCLTGIKE